MREVVTRFFVLAVALFTGKAYSEEIHTTICQLVKEQANMDGKSVRFKAIYETDFQHFSFYMDQGCVLDAGFDSDGVNSVERFKDAVGSLLDSSRHRFYVDVSGVFRVEQNWQPPALLSAVVNPGPHGFFDLGTVWSFRNTNEDRSTNQLQKSNAQQGAAGPTPRSDAP